MSNHSEGEGVLGAGDGAIGGVVGTRGAAFKDEGYIIAIAGINGAVVNDTYVIALNVAYIIIGVFAVQFHGDRVDVGDEAGDAISSLALDLAKGLGVVAVGYVDVTIVFA